MGEDLYRVDRMLAHLRMVGALARLARRDRRPVHRAQAPHERRALGFDEVLAHYFGPLGIPVAYGFPVGHIDDQWTLPLGVRARLDADAGEVELLEPAVALGLPLPALATPVVSLRHGHAHPDPPSLPARSARS